MKKITLTIFFAVVTSITAVQAQSALDVDYGTLMNEINNNPVRASQLYHNKTIRTTIVVDMVTSDTQVMAGGSAILYVNFASSERSKVANLNKGQRITVRGVYVGNTLFPNIQRAVIETQSQPQQNQQPQAKPQTQQQPAQPQQQKQPQNQPQQQTSTLPPQLQGTWVNKGSIFTGGDSIIVITGNQIKFPSGYIENVENWEAVVNPNSGNNRDFPSGWAIYNSHWENPTYFYLDKNGRRLIQGNQVGDKPVFYTKQ